MDLPNEYYRVDVDLAKPDTFPWVSHCQACDIRKLAARRSFPKNSRAQTHWVTYIGEHFWHEHKIELIQFRASKRLGELQPILGPFTRVEWAVRYQVVRPDSPIVGRVDYDRRVSREDAAVAMPMYAEHAEDFAHVAIVSRTVTTTEWKEA